MKTRSFDFLRRFLLERAALSIDHEKCDLIENRLAPVARKYAVADVDALLLQLELERAPELARNVLESMVTNETFFFRDRTPFDQLRTLLPHLMKRREDQKHIRIWSAACSTGQEPYSIAMVLDETARPLAGWRVDIVATDISEAALTAARYGAYNQFEVQRGLPVSYLLRYFHQEGDRWRIAEHLRTHVRFKQFNLMSDFREFGWFDVVFCRNVLIYFDVSARISVLDRIARLMPADGILVLGSAETVIGVSDLFERHPDYPMLWSRKAIERPSLRLVAGA